MKDVNYLIFRVIVCPAFGFNSTKGREIGYSFPSQLLAGSINSEPESFSWNGIQSLNLSWKQIQDFMFPELKTLRENYNFWKISKDNVHEINLLPFMKCLEVKNYSNRLIIGSNSELNVFVMQTDKHTTGI